ncbi:MAG: hypothetical protein AAFX50_13725 [Acidobacteriota bacterium]
MMRLAKDVLEFIELLNSSSVEYLVVGGHAVGFHGFPRLTGDVDFFVRADGENAARLIDVFQRFGFEDAENLRPVLMTVGRSIKIGMPPNRIDVITGVSGIDFDEAWTSRVSGHLDSVPVDIIGRDALIKNKRASGRPKDLIDAAEIERLTDSKPGQGTT